MNAHGACGHAWRIWTRRSATTAFRRDGAELQRLVDAEQGGFAIAPWDYRHDAEKLRQDHHDLDLDEVTPYLQLDRRREALFMTANFVRGKAGESVTVDDARTLFHEFGHALHALVSSVT